MPRTVLVFGFATLCLALAADCVVDLAAAQAPTARRRSRTRERFTVPPPKWDASVRDLFFPDARHELGPGGPPSRDLANVPSSVPTTATPMPTPPATDAPVTPSASTEVAWSKLISAETLEDEVKELAQSLSDLTQSAGKFKSGGYQDARVQLSVLATLFGIIAEYDGEVRWKEVAGGMRDSLSRAGKNAKAGSDSTYQEVRARSDELVDLVRGNAVEGKEASPREDWSAVADRRPLMTRLELGQRDRLVPWTASQQDFERNAPQLLREAELLAALGRVVQAEGYEYGDDATYQEYARGLEAAFVALTEALRASDFSRAQEAAGAANRSCDQCHADFRG